MELGLVSKLSNLSFGNTQFNNRIAYLINFLSVVIFIYCGAHFVVRNWFTVNKIVIEGSVNHITPVQLSYIAHNKLHGTFFTLDIQELKSEFEELPWVSEVSVKRHFPHTVVVKLKEYQAIARIGDDNLLAENGVVFDGADDSLDLPIFYVQAKSSDDALKRYLQIESVLKKHGDKLAKLWLTTPRVTKFTTAKNLNVTICSENITSKLILLDTYWDKLHTLSPSLNSVNFCYKSALAIN
jgi:cell division septal protein FtsQ